MIQHLTSMWPLQVVIAIELEVLSVLNLFLAHTHIHVYVYEHSLKNNLTNVSARYQTKL